MIYYSMILQVDMNNFAFFNVDSSVLENYADNVYSVNYRLKNLKFL